MLDIEADAPLSPADAAHAGRLLALARSLGIDPLDLDEAVHDAASQYASGASNSSDRDDEDASCDELHDEAGRQAADINNHGLDKQVAYLVAQSGHKETEQIIRQVGGMKQSEPASTDPDEITELRGVFSDGYAADDINRVFGVIEDVYGQRLVCRWELFDEEWYRGNSEFYFEDGDAYYYDAGIYSWLSGAPDAPVDLGNPSQWRGKRVPDSDAEGPQHAATDDGMHNVALADTE
ncbi:MULTISPECIES: hypothetical protein [Streptomyces]|uniref:Uncharacterized protein n=1 Tax=Streptomyces griseiscabiei TaxID=2993540 RepID=A0ABU4LJB8_9ACTN|nr:MULTISPECIES: hypothetical protein [Streptomyces]MBZ3908261.1 hypothetical protein [Streptomyces griseiscabiei]MDX2915673.1 hypothetical protein [Streptomyces griseiscabiei]